ncbi:putative receptor-like protein kinase [Vitis vinifera]|uniref:Putative receptor-like protein kinase n=1 Tax=Vitis vinifera TaxID=29760 RepID=A0A438CXA3_VITVI|nr:putative receptor-like protein kinase [Vitis vinifera]
MPTCSKDGEGPGMEVWGLILVVMVSVFVENGEAQTKSLLINCGTNSSVNVDGRRWVGDLAPDNNLTLSSLGVAASTDTFSGDTTFAQLYETARIFPDSLNYTASLNQGNYSVRLHFYPFSFEKYNTNESSFSVVANGLKLASQLNVPGEISHKNSYLQSSGRSFGFINAIEIVPVVDNLFFSSVSKVGGTNSVLNLSGRGIEAMYRLNVGGPEITPDQDLDLWRTWEVDSSYMFTANAGSEVHNSSNITYASMNDSVVAPLAVYETARSMSNTEVLEKRFNMSWKFEVDPDFEYLIRLHFCELFYERANQRSFRIYINNRTAADNFDVFLRAGGMNKAYHQDFLDMVSSKINTLWIQLGPDTTVGASGTDAILNGLEIFKLSRNGNLAYVERFDSTKSSAGSKTSKTQTLWVGLGAGVASIAMMAVIFSLIFYFCKRWRKKSSATKNKSPVIGVGGFGKVYKGEIDDGTPAAIKRANPQSEQGLAEFQTEIEMLSKLRHRHLVSMIGFCEEQNEMILVYEYMANGTLRSHLFGSELPPLTWKQRLEACIGAARGLHYLHTGAERGIIHRDVKTTNILIDENFVAKMADFGLSKTGPAWEHTHVSTAVKGSFGYLDPEYFRRQQLTEKSDVYSFGVVLFEVVCARAVINPSLPRDQINLAEWAMHWQQQRSLETIIDPHLKGNYSPDSLRKFGEIAEKCLADEGKNRPTMGEVLWHLEYVLQLHEAWLHTNVGENSFSSSQALGNLEEGLESAHLDEENEISLKMKQKRDSATRGINA